MADHAILSELLIIVRRYSMGPFRKMLPVSLEYPIHFQSVLNQDSVLAILKAGSPDFLSTLEQYSRYVSGLQFAEI